MLPHSPLSNSPTSLPRIRTSTMLHVNVSHSVDFPTFLPKIHRTSAPPRPRRCALQQFSIPTKSVVCAIAPPHLRARHSPRLWACTPPLISVFAPRSLYTSALPHLLTCTPSRLLATPKLHLLITMRPRLHAFKPSRLYTFARSDIYVSAILRLRASASQNLPESRAKYAHANGTLAWFRSFPLPRLRCLRF